MCSRYEVLDRLLALFGAVAVGAFAPSRVPLFSLTFESFASFHTFLDLAFTALNPPGPNAGLRQNAACALESPLATCRRTETKRGVA